MPESVGRSPGLCLGGSRSLTNVAVVGGIVSTASYPGIVSALITMAIGVGTGIGIAVGIGKRKAVSISNPIATPKMLYQSL